jgi:hypothetical protein
MLPPERSFVGCAGGASGDFGDMKGLGDYDDGEETKRIAGGAPIDLT